MVNMLTWEFTGEDNFDDKQASGTVTPVPEADGKGAKKRRTGNVGKKAKTLKQRLAVADGTVWVGFVFLR